MTTIEMVRGAMQMADKVMMRMADDMRDAPMTRTIPGGGNHPLWIMGHLTVVEGAIPQVVFGEPNVVEHWWPLFGQGTTPRDDASAYPSYDEVLATYRELRANNLARLNDIGEAGLNAAPKAVPPGFENEMQTIGQTYLTMAMHQMIHSGQLADTRRAAGRQPFV